MSLNLFLIDMYIWKIRIHNVILISIVIVENKKEKIFKQVIILILLFIYLNFIFFYMKY